MYKPKEICDVANAVRKCKRCKLAQTRKNAVPGEGSFDPKVVIIGEGPGKNEDEQGKPFVGRSGDLLTNMLKAIDLDRNDDCFILNCVKCRPPNNRNPEFEELKACEPFLDKQLLTLEAPIILCMGLVAGRWVFKAKEMSIAQLREHNPFKFSYDEEGTKPLHFVFTYHPAYLLRNPKMKYQAWEDLKIVRSLLEPKNEVAKRTV